jgi:hypothetical protein
MQRRDWMPRWHQTATRPMTVPALASAPSQVIPLRPLPKYAPVIRQVLRPQISQRHPHPVTALHPNFSHELADPPSNRDGRLTPQIVQSQSPPTSLLNLPEIVSRPLAIDFQLALSEQSQFKCCGESEAFLQVS